MIPFNKPYLTGKESIYIEDAVKTGKLSGNGIYTQKCQNWFENFYGFGKCLLTTSCTDALEMSAILINIQPGDEVILPSYTFVSTANAFLLRGAKLVFVDSRIDHPGINEDSIEELITSKTKVIVPVHYAGFACDMDKIMYLASKYNLFVIEDAAQAIDSFYIGKDGIKRPLGSIGHFSAFSFHETKNIISGEGGMLVINDKQFEKRAEIIWEKGTNRSSFFRGEVDKYNWVDIGSSFLPSEIIAAFLWAQIEKIEDIQKRRSVIWNKYYQKLNIWAQNNGIGIPHVPNYSTNNFHLFYILTKDLKQREELILFLKSLGIYVVFHYSSLHKSDFFHKNYKGLSLKNSDNYSECLIRLPLFYDLEDKIQDYIIESLIRFF
jgi:dTDP-4-amino-4,6-dideoxygalactose transaminase